jgi:hypothetical protein
MDVKKRYVFDLDNTICDTKKNENGNWDYLNAKPFVNRVNLINSLYDEGHYIIIETARGCVSKKNWYEDTYNQLINFGLKFNELRTGIKFNADFFIDDKGINSESFFSYKNYEEIDPYSDNTKIIIFNEIFVEKNKLRLDEYVHCINKNVNNPIIEKIFFVCDYNLYHNNIGYFDNLLKEQIVKNSKINLILDKDNKRFTFNNFINYCNTLIPNNTIVVVSNLDIFIPYNKNWENLEKDFFSITKNECCMALSRTEYVNDTYSFKDERAWSSGEFADCWVFKTPLRLKEEHFPFQIPVGSAPTCDNHMFLIMGNTHEQVFNWADKYVIYHYDLIRKPEVLEKKSGRMIMNDDVVTLDPNYFDKLPQEKWKITPYQNWDSIFQKYKLNKRINEKKMTKGALEDKYALEELVNLVDKFQIKRIVETGTYKGWSTKVLCDLGLKIDSIEIDSNLYDMNKENLKSKNLTLHLGDSVEILENIISEGETNLLFFLDSHWYEFPLLQELEIIKNKKIKPVILIHDFFVPDEKNNPMFGYDSYHGVNLDYNLIKNYINSIYENDYEFHYTKKIDCVNSGTIYIYPKVLNI